MRAALTAGAFAALVAFGARADEQVAPPLDIDGEIAWARANWPGAFERPALSHADRQAPRLVGRNPYVTALTP